MSDQVTIDTFIETLIEQRGYADAPEETLAELRKDIRSRLDEFLVTRIVSQLSNDEVALFEKLIDEGKSSEQLRAFASEHIADYQTFITGTLLTFQDAYLTS